MIESLTNKDSITKEPHKYIKFRINHPKLNHQIFSFSTQMPF